MDCGCWVHSRIYGFLRIYANNEIHSPLKQGVCNPFCGSTQLATVIYGGEDRGCWIHSPAPAAPSEYLHPARFKTSLPPLIDFPDDQTDLWDGNDFNDFNPSTHLGSGLDYLDPFRSCLVHPALNQLLLPLLLPTPQGGHPLLLLLLPVPL